MTSNKFLRHKSSLTSSIDSGSLSYSFWPLVRASDGETLPAWLVKD